MDNSTNVTAQSGGALQITWVSLFINIVLAFSKCVLGLWAHSRALLADGLHSFMDLSSDLVTLFGLKMASKPEDENHHYGHHKFESLSTLFISMILLLFCVGLIYSSIVALLRGVSVTPEWPALIVAAISVLVKEVLYWRTILVVNRTGSRLLKANAWHHRADSFSSLVVFIAISIALWGGPAWLWVDSATGLLLGVYLSWQSLKLFLQACNDLLDSAPDQAIIDDLREHIIPTPGAIAYHNFRVRRIGDLLEVDLHLQVDSGITVEESHLIASQVKNNILKQHSNVYNVLVHVEPATQDHLRAKGISEIDL